MHRDNIQQEPNLYDPEKPEEFLYDAELLNAWFDQPIEEDICDDDEVTGT
jgi:hypothetical protein